MGVDEDLSIPAWCEWPLVRHVLPLFVGLDGPPRMTKRQWRVLGAVAVAGFFNNLDADLFPVCLKQIQNSLGIPEQNLGQILSVVNVGSAFSFFVAIMADHYGRRSVFFGCVLLYTALTVASALQRQVSSLIVLQMLARIFLRGEGALAQVYLVEEMDAKNRGLAMGIYSSLSVLGPGILMILYGVMGSYPNGWRYLFMLGLFQLPMLIPIWNTLPESNEFLKSASLQGRREDSEVGVQGILQPVLHLWNAYPARLAVLLWISFWNGFAYTPSDMFKIKYLQDERGLSPKQTSGLTVAAGLAAMIIFPLLGRASDKFGRRALLSVFFAVGPLGILLFYNVPGDWYLLCYPIQMMCGFALSVLISTFFAELFPASHRCTATVFLSVFYVGGGVVGLICESAAYAVFQVHSKAISLVLLPAFMAPLLVAFCLPETNGRSLAEIAPERLLSKEEQDDAEETQPLTSDVDEIEPCRV